MRTICLFSCISGWLLSASRDLKPATAVEIFKMKALVIYLFMVLSLVTVVLSSASCNMFDVNKILSSVTESVRLGV